MSGGDRGASSRGASNSSSGGGGGAAATRGGSGGSASSAGGVGHHGGGAPRGSAAASGAAGRERAIETILDRDPRGCYYRAARVVEELVPQLSSCRPNLITKSALVEQAWSLKKYELVPSLPEEIGPSTATPTYTPPLSLDGVTKERVIHHLERGFKSPTSTKLATNATSALRTIYEENLHKGARVPATVEESLLSMCKNLDDPIAIHTAILSLLTIVKDPGNEQDVASDEEVEVSLPVGHLLALLENGGAASRLLDDSELRVPREWLDFYAQAAAVSEERLEIQKARMLARLPSSPSTDSVPAAAGVAATATSDTPAAATASNATPASATPATSSASPMAFGGMSPPDELVAAAAAAQALSAAFEQVFSGRLASTLRDDEDEEEDDDDGDDDDEDDDDDDSSNAVSDGDDDESDGDDENEDEAVQQDDTATSANDGQGAGEPMVLESSRGGVDETTISEFDDDGGLRQALQLLSVTTAAPRSNQGTPVASTSEGLTEEEVVLVEGEHDMTPDRAQVELDELLKDEDEDSPALPSMPKPPTTPSPGGTYDNVSSLDPSIPSRFGSIPLPQVLIHLLRHVSTVQLDSARRAFPARQEAPRAVSPTHGGMGSRLFEASTPASSIMAGQAKREENDVALQLIVATLLLILEKRDTAIAGLQKAILREQQRDTPVASNAGSLYASAVVEEDDEEVDDPADALAMNYIEDDVELTSESLENKGMRRKAAAAAYDAAALLKSLQKRTQAAKEAVKLYSAATLYVLRALRLFFREHACFSFVAAGKLSNALTTLLSPSAYRSYSELLPNEDVKVFLSLELYREAVWVWGENSPMLFPFDQTLTVFRSLVEDCKLRGGECSVTAQSVDSLVTPPCTELETKVHKLQVLSRRLRESDMLDSLISRPVPHLVEDDNGIAVPTRQESDNVVPESPNRMASLASSLSESRFGVLAEVRDDVERLYYAICHRYHTRVVLMDGTITEIAPDNPSTTSRTPKSLSTGDALKVAAQPGPPLVFDAAKCADSMAIITDNGANGPSVNQRASKVWGSVLATHCFSPKSGVHRFAVRLDRCERGHVFVGVSTLQASVKTYVGGDKHGWGMIGTQALWHDRRKIRGDYGATFRTGSTIVVTLDTDSGTLSFSSWKDGSFASSSVTMDPSQSFSSPRKSGPVQGTVEDWGLAFEGLPLDSRFYPAVGLYQRDDKVTLLSVESSGGAAVGELESGCFFPRHSDSTDAKRVRTFNDRLTWDATEYVAEVLGGTTKALYHNDGYFFGELLPSLASSLCLIPTSIPILSSRFAYTLLPHLQRCMASLHACRNGREVSDKLFRTGPLSGKWVIRATGSTGSAGEVEEYVVDLQSLVEEDGSILGFEGKGVGTTGKSKNGRVAIAGTFTGSSLTFVEDWSDGSADSSDDASSCVASARLGLDGKRFEGCYRNVQYGSSGQIAGVRVDDSVQLKEAPSSDCNMRLDSMIALCEATVSLAIGHLATIIGEDSPGDLETIDAPSSPRLKIISRVLSGTLLSRCSLAASGACEAESESMQVKSLYAPPFTVNELCGVPINAIMESVQDLKKKAGVNGAEILKWVSAVDEVLSAQLGATGSLSSLCREEFSSARRRIVAVLLTYCDIGSNASSEKQLEVWRAAVQIAEDKVRSTMSSADGSYKQACAAACELLIRVSDFLLSLDRLETPILALPDAKRELVAFYRVIRDLNDIALLRQEMSNASQRAILRLCAFGCVNKVLQDGPTPCCLALECLASGLHDLLNCGHHDSLAFLHEDEDFPDLDGNHLQGLSGAWTASREALTSRVHALSRSLGSLFDQVVSRQATTESTEAVDSLILSLLVLYSGSWSGRGSASRFRESRILQILRRLIASRRSTTTTEDNLPSASDNVAVRRIQALCKRDRDRSIVMGAIGVLHVIVYQFAKDALDDVTVEQSLDLLREELESTMPFLICSSPNRTPVMKELRRWSTACLPRHKEITGEATFRSSGIVGDAGLHYLREHGTPITTTSQYAYHAARVLNQKDHSAVVAEPMHSSFGFSCAHFASLIHVLGCALRFRGSLDVVASDKRWMGTMLRAAGMTVEWSETGFVSQVSVETEGTIPSRFRSRILRVLFHVLQSSDPSPVIPEALLTIAGHTSNAATRSLDPDDWLVSREAVTLLRRLHSLDSWRECVNLALRHCILNGTDPSHVWRKVGVFSFFSGDIGGLSRGAFILLKPPSATALSQQQLSSPSSKGHFSGAGGSSPPLTGVTPHHIVGNGTESVVAGLCRNDASAGIVSNFDVKNGSCEVILIGRDAEESIESQRNTWSRAPSKRSAGRRTLTVRAIRTPLSDVVHAQEVPLFLDDTVPVSEIVVSMLKASLERLLDATRLDGFQDGWPDEVTHVRDISIDIQVLRSCIVILSDEKLLSHLLSSKSRSIVFRLLLNLASFENVNHPNKETDTGTFIAALPIHEATHGLLLSIVREALTRIDALQQAPDHIWCEEMEKVRDLQASISEAEPVDQDGADALGNECTSSSKTTPDHGELRARAMGESVAREGESQVSTRSISQSTGGSDSDEDDESEAAAVTAAAHLREAAIAQMSELGLPRSWSELALRRTGGTNIEAAVTFCLERSGDMERLLAEERERDRMLQRGIASSTSRRRGSRDNATSHLLRQLQDMGFPGRWCAEALAVTGNNVDEALTWILTNGERLSEEDEGVEADEAQLGERDDLEDDSLDEDEEEEEEDQGSTLPAGESSVEDTKSALDSESLGWTASILPLRFISGRANIDSKSLQISGLPTGGFTSVGTKGVLLTSGKWYYEAILETAGCLQIGWADASFAQHCNSDRGDGCGDGPSSWSFDGWRRYRWHCTATEWGCRWKEGDVVGCLVDMDEKVVSFHLNGRGEEIGMGVAFSGSGFRPTGGVFTCVSFNRREKLRLILGGSGSSSFKYPPPPGYRGVGEAVLSSVDELNKLLEKESLLDPHSAGLPSCPAVPSSRKFLCDFADGEHGHELMAWAHRYYGSDASVHLGSAHSKVPPLAKSSPKATAQVEEPTPSLVCSMHAEAAWQKLWKDGESLRVDRDVNEVKAFVVGGYLDLVKSLCLEIRDVTASISVLLARKLLLHLMITLGSEFNPLQFIKDSEISLIRSLWKTIEDCASLRSVGWVGEAGSMAVAAEALGLGITSTEHLHPRVVKVGRSLLLASDGICDSYSLPNPGITQLLSTVRISSMPRSTGDYFVAGAEAAIGSDSGGALLSYLRESLQSAACRSCSFRQLLLDTVRRGVRLLAVVEYDGDPETDVDSQQEDEEASDRNAERSTRSRLTRKEAHDGVNASTSPDARLVTYITGLLLSQPVREIDDFELVQRDLAECWSVGLLSGSLPWRMICASTLAGILNDNPRALASALVLSPSLARYFGRLSSTTVRRLWAERAASPVCSRYAQSMIELLSAVNRGVEEATNLPVEFMTLWGKFEVDAATPIPFQESIDAGTTPPHATWEADAGFISSDSSWPFWVGKVELLAVEWKPPTRSSVRALVDAGQGPPRLDEACFVLRGVDWNERFENEDGHEEYEAEKAQRDEEKKALEELEVSNEPNPAEASATREAPEGTTDDHIDPAADQESLNGDQLDSGAISTVATESDEIVKKKKRKIQNPRLPLGTVLSVESWDGVPAMARRVRWDLTGEEGIYRYGGDGGKFDLCHVETNAKRTRVKKRYALPESAEQCAARHGFGVKRTFNVLLRLSRHFAVRGDEEWIEDGILEWPDFGAASRVSVTHFRDGTVSIEENDLLFGAKDSGWEPRFGQPSYEPGSVIFLSPTNASGQANRADLDSKSSSLSMYDELLGSATYDVKNLRDRADGSRVKVTSEMRFYRSRRPSSCDDPLAMYSQPCPPFPLTFDNEYHATSISLSHDGRTASCVASDGRCAAYASLGFTKGVHYWEVKLEQADVGSVYVGVAEKPTSSGSGSSHGYESPPRLNRWQGWGFVNFRATYTSGAERVYGAHCHSGDTIGVLLDCDAGRVSFFFDGLKYGEHIMNDLGCAFENLSPFGFNVDGCGSGGIGQGAPSGFDGTRGGRQPAQGNVRPRTLWPVIGLRNQGDRVTLSAKWSSCYGIDGAAIVRNALKVDKMLNYFSCTPASPLPPWLLGESYAEYRRWYEGTRMRSVTRGSSQCPYTTHGTILDLDSSPQACAAASAGLGLSYALLAGDRVRLTRSAGRILELAEEAVVLGAFQGRLYYRIVSQKSEGGSLTEGGGRAWFWDESEVVDGLPFVKPGLGLGVPLPKPDRFRCLATGGLRIVYEGGAVLRSDLEIFDGSINLGTAPVSTLIPRSDVIERRVNSSGVVRYRVRYNDLEGWISARIRGGKEEMIVKPEEDTTIDDERTELYPTPYDCARKWHEDWKVVSERCESADLAHLNIQDLESFGALVSDGFIAGLSPLRSDALLASVLNTLSSFNLSGDAIECSFREVASALSFACAVSGAGNTRRVTGSTPDINQAVSTIFAECGSSLPSLHAMLARIAVVKALNRRTRLALPWLSLRPCQEGSALFGGLHGLGTSVDRAGRARLSKLSESWIQVPSIATRLRSVRGLIFTSVKRDFLLSITETTTTPTPLSHDEYELPREIRTVRINRLKAARAMESEDAGSARKNSVFSQLQNEIRNWGGAALRRGYVAKGHGGQKRAFKVKLVGEGVNDYSGPYREAFTDAIAELAISDPDGSGYLGVLDRTPNNASSIGENRDLLMFSLNGRDVTMLPGKCSEPGASMSERLLRRDFASLMTPRDETSREVEEALVFLGRITGTAFRHGIPVDLPLATRSVWKCLTEEPGSELEQLRELDLLAYQQLKGDSLSGDIPPLLLWQQRMLNSFAEGLGNVLPVEIFPLFTGEELRDTLCGNPEVDVDLLRRVVEYEGYEPDDAVVEYFWQTLRELGNDERKQFLQFVWARNRLPMREADFEAPFKIQRDAINTGDRADQALPSASTCFFSLTLPNYSSRDILRAKLLFAINNVTTMETDFQTNSAEISEGYRAFS